MPAIEIPKEKWNGKVREITLGATSADGGSRTKTITVGGETTLPFLHFEGEIPRTPAIAVEIQDQPPTDWSPVLLEAGIGIFRRIPLFRHILHNSLRASVN